MSFMYLKNTVEQSINAITKPRQPSRRPRHRI